MKETVLAGYNFRGIHLLQGTSIYWLLFFPPLWNPNFEFVCSVADRNDNVLLLIIK